jgi:hypothetical protein
MGGSGLSSIGNQGQCASNDFPSKWARVPEVTSSRGTHSSDGLPFHIENMSSGLDCAPGEPLLVLLSEPPAIYPFSFPSLHPSFFKLPIIVQGCGYMIQLV